MKRFLLAMTVLLPFISGSASAQLMVTYGHVTGQVVDVKRGQLCNLITLQDQTSNQPVTFATLHEGDLALADGRRLAGQPVTLAYYAGLQQNGQAGMYCMSCPSVSGSALFTDYNIITSIR